MKKTFAVYELSNGQPSRFYNNTTKKFTANKNEATLWTQSEAEKVKDKLEKPRIDSYQKTGKNYTELHIGDLYKKGILKETTMKLTKTQLREIIRGEVQSLKEAAPKLKPKMYIMVKNTRTGEEHVIAGFTGAGDAHIALPAFTKIAPAHLEYRVYSGK